MCDVFPSHLKGPDSLLAEIEMVGPDISNSKAKTLRDAAIWLKGKYNFYPSLAKAYQLPLTIPISVASNERSFSKLRMVKNYLRSMLKEERIDFLMISACAVDVVDDIDLEKIAEEWSKLKTRKIRL